MKLDTETRRLIKDMIEEGIQPADLVRVEVSTDPADDPDTVN